jgi:O-antigen ligase
MSTIDQRNNKLWLTTAGFWLLIALYLVSFFSKAGVNFFAALVYFITIYLISSNDRNLFRREPLLLLLLFPLGVGLLVSFFSGVGGWIGVAGYLDEFKFFFLPFAFSVLLRNKHRIEWLFLSALASAAIILVYGFSQEEQRVFGMFHGYFLYPDVRTSQMIMIVVIASIVFLDDQMFRERYPKIAIIIFLLVPALLFALYMGSIRSTWIGFVLAILCYTIIFRPKWLVPIVLFGIVIFYLNQESALSKELSSVLDFRENISNNTRLQLWSTGLDFSDKNFIFGVGKTGIQQQFLDFYNMQPYSYKETYSLVSNSIGNFHNSYLQILIEWGVLTIGAFILSGAMLTIRLIQALKVVPQENLVYIRVFFVVSVAYVFSQFFHNEFISYSATLYFLLMYGAIYVTSRSEPEWIAKT